jgi:hypothetical protein
MSMEILVVVVLTALVVLGATRLATSDLPHPRVRSGL